MMASIKTLNSALFKQSDNSQFQTVFGNKELWLKSLEKNGLYSALEKFEVVESQQQFKATVNIHNVVHHSRSEINTKVISTRKQSMISLKPAVLENSEVKTNLPLIHNSHLTVDNGTLNKNKSVANHQHIFNVFSTDNNKRFHLAGLYKSYEMNMPWLSKNTTITMANSGLEVWVRDAGITGSKLSEVLKHLQYSMAHLGASLAKVTINGKVVFNEKNHHLSMEG